MKGPLIALLFLAVFPCICLAQLDGLFITNGSHILFSKNGNAEPKVVFTQENARIVGLDTDVRDQMIFWSDIGFYKRGIYRADVDGDGAFSGVTKLMFEDIGEVNGLSVDYVNKHLYWTDSRRRSVEVADYDGANHRVLIHTGLAVPRGILADPYNNYLFWNDQGSSPKIERSRLDGSERMSIVTSGLKWPNQMLVDHDQQKLFWVDADGRAVYSSDFQGGSRQTVASLESETGPNAIFGLAMKNEELYVSVWKSGKIISLNMNGENVKSKFSGVGTSAMFSLCFARIENQPEPSSPSPCSSNNGGCSHLCLPASTSRRCACPSYGGLTLASSAVTCEKPSSILLYCMAKQGIVGFKPMSNPDDPDTYIVGRSSRPVGVTYDPAEQKVYWSDVFERTIYVANLDGTSVSSFLTSNDTIGIVDGLAVDINARRLYFSNMGSVTIDRHTFSWHKVEAIGLDGTGRRTIYDKAEKPRGLFIDQSSSGKVYFTDWGIQAGVIQVNKDGSSPEQVLFPGLHNPNGVYQLQDKVYITDSHYKTKKAENDGRFGPEKDAALYAVVGNNAQQLDNLQLETPFDISHDGSYFYISDWGRRAIIQITIDNSGTAREEKEFLSNVENVMGLHFAVTNANPGQDVCSNNQCGEGSICFNQNGQATCTCSSYDAKVLESFGTCSVPTNYLILADFNSLKIQSLENNDKSVYNAYGGSTFASNIVSVAHDEQNGVVYFSDVNRRSIYYHQLQTGETHLLLKTDTDIIDGMAFADGKIYWTDYYAGLIAFADTTEQPIERKILRTSLDKPRAIAVKDGRYLYWTEWGAKSRVRRVNLPNGDGTKDLVKDVLSRPNSLYIDGDKMYIGDTPIDADAKVLECDLNGEKCQELAYMTGVPKHIYSIAKYGRFLYYTDWKMSELAVVDMDTGVKSTVVKDLMRPTEFIIKYDMQMGLDKFCTGHRCSDKCVAFYGGHYCACNSGSVLITNTTCGDTDDLYKPSSSGCPSTCGANSVCAQKIGTTEFECVCKPGYEGQSCSACAAGKFKAFAGNYACETCGLQSKESADRSHCVCNGDMTWNRLTNRCEGSKPGSCPSLPTLDFCSGATCDNDADCKGSQKCCNAGNCPNSGKLCRDPVNVPQYCVIDGMPLKLEETFKVDACHSCMCKATSVYENPLFGDSVCKIMDCPMIKCSNGQVMLDPMPGMCCPYCGVSNAPPFKFTNCPSQPLQLSLPSDHAYVKLNYRWMTEDQVGSRPVSLEQEPRDNYFFFMEDAQKVKVTARAGDDSDECNFEVVVVDKTAPTIVCPDDKVISTKSLPARGDWSPPKVKDNVCGRSGMAACKLEETSNKYGKDLAEGMHTITYTATDQAGLTSQCSFKVTVKLETNCAPPSFTRGSLTCDSSSPTRSCELMCDAGYSVYLQAYASFTCNADVWTPRITSRTRRLQCRDLDSSPVVIQGRMTISGLDCPSRSSMSSTVIEVQEAMLNQIGNNSPVELRVQGRGCGAFRRTKRAENELTLEIFLESKHSSSGSKNQMMNDIDQMIMDLKRDIETGNVQLYEDADIEQIKITVSQATDACPSGTEMSEATCAACPVGTYEMNGKCEDCAKGSYQDQEGQSQCTVCPAGQSTSAEGSVFGSDCLPVATNPPDYYGPSGAGSLTVTSMVIVTCALLAALTNYRQY